MLMLLSPAKTMDFKTEYTGKTSMPIFLNEAQEVVSELKKLSKTEIAKLMGISSKLSDLNYQRFSSYRKDYKNVESAPALYAYRGDVYQGFELEQYKKADLDFAQKHLLILSGFYGVVRPLDLIQAYRLEMSIKLKVAKCKNLYEFWSDSITKEINKTKAALIVNLASNEYFSAVNKAALKSELIDIDFKDKKAGKYQTIGLFAKKARGNMANWIIRNRVTKKQDIKAFCESEYAFNKSYSSEDTYVFTRG